MIILLLFLAPLVMSGAGVSRLLRDGILESEDDGAPETFARQLDNVSPSKLDEAEFRREDFDDDDDIPGHKEHRSAGGLGSLFGIPTSPPRLGPYRCGLQKWRRSYPCDFADSNDTQGTNYGCSNNKCWKGCSTNCEKPKPVGSWCDTVGEDFLYQKCSTHADCFRALRMDCFGRRNSELLDLMCDAGFQDRLGRDCEVYERRKWCKKDGDHFGSNWNGYWGNFKTYYANGEGKGALVCPQCGCPSAFYMIDQTEPIWIGYRLATRADVLQNWEEVKKVISYDWAIVELEDGEIEGRFGRPIHDYKRSGYEHKLIIQGAMAAAAVAAAPHQQGEMQRVWEELSNEQQQTEALQRQMAEQRQQQEQPQ